MTVLGSFQEELFAACVDLLHAVPSVALKGASTEEMWMLIDRFERQQEEMQKLRDGQK